MAEERMLTPPKARPWSLEYHKDFYSFKAQRILCLDDKTRAENIIVDLQMETHMLREYYEIPLMHFMQYRVDLLQRHLGRYRGQLGCEDGDYSLHPELLVNDLLNLVYCLAGYGPTYQHPVDD